MSHFPRGRLHAYAEAVAEIAVEGATDRFCGRPQDQNPYSDEYAPTDWDAWDLGWRVADELLEVRGAEEAARWLREAA
jgi:hypothetical protein